MRLLPVGRSGAGRSATGDTLLGERAFESTLATKGATAVLPGPTPTPPPAPLLVTELGRFIEEDEEAAQRLQGIFGADLSSHTIALLTCAEDLAGRSPHDDLRYGGFNDRAAGAEGDQRAPKLMGMAYRAARENGGKRYSNGTYPEPGLTEEKVECCTGRYKAERKITERPGATPCRIIVGCGIILFVLAVFPDFLYFPRFSLFPLIALIFPDFLILW
ncbi:GTPase IMAP family member 6-like [Spheniscus humboldti]